MEIRDLLWAQLLLTEMQLGGSYAPLYKASQSFLADLRMMSCRAEESALCVKDRCQELRLNVNFAQMDAARMAARSETHPCHLISPYLDKLPKYHGDVDSDNTSYTY